MLLSNELLTVLLFVALIVLSFFYYKEISSFPVTLYVCGSGFIDCFPVAKYDDRVSCESANEKGGWLCDSTDKRNIKWKESD